MLFWIPSPSQRISVSMDVVGSINILRQGLAFFTFDLDIKVYIYTWAEPSTHILKFPWIIRYMPIW